VASRKEFLAPYYFECLFIVGDSVGGGGSDGDQAAVNVT